MPHTLRFKFGVIGSHYEIGLKYSHNQRAKVKHRPIYNFIFVM